MNMGQHMQEMLKNVAVAFIVHGGVMASFSKQMSETPGSGGCWLVKIKSSAGMT